MNTTTRKEVSNKQYRLVLVWEDFYNSEKVMRCLQHELGYESEQAEQCCLIAINKGLYAIKSGSLNLLSQHKYNLNRAGINTIITAS